MRTQILILLSGLLLIIVWLGYMQMKARPSIRVGSTELELERQLGKPMMTLTQESLPNSPAGGYLYTEAGSERVLRASELPAIDGRALYYTYGYIGTTCVVIYLSPNKQVNRVFYGGT